MQTTTTSSWKNHPKLNPILEFETWKCPVTHLQQALKDEHIKSTLPYSSSSEEYEETKGVDVLRHIHPRIPIIQNHNHNQEESTTTFNTEKKKTYQKDILIKLRIFFFQIVVFPHLCLL